MVDIHSHIINNVDDGSKSEEESVEILKELYHQGVTDVILTPHFNKHKLDVLKEDAEEGFKRIKNLVAYHKLNIDVHLGNEIYYKNNESFIEVMEKERYNTLAYSQYFLLELSSVGKCEDLSEGCYEVMMENLVPVIAHVERYPYLFQETNYETLREVMKNGALLQLNCDNIINKDKTDSYEFAHFLLENKVVSFVASDVHNMTSRKPYVKEAYDLVSLMYGEDYADEIFTTNGEKLLKNQWIEKKELPYIKVKKKSNMLQNILNKMFQKS